jgi:hypothetical protein
VRRRGGAVAVAVHVVRFRGDLTEAGHHDEETLAAVRALDERQMASDVLGSLSTVALDVNDRGIGGNNGLSVSTGERIVNGNDAPIQRGSLATNESSASSTSPRVPARSWSTRAPPSIAVLHVVPGAGLEPAWP